MYTKKDVIINVSAKYLTDSVLNVNDAIFDERGDHAVESRQFLSPMA